MFDWLKNKQGLVLLVVVFILFSFGLGMKIIQYPPRTTHIWRQSDCLAYTKTYYQRNSGFFDISAYNLAGEGGRAALSEIPVLYYLSAKLCMLFGFHYWIIRGITVLCYFLGLYYLLLCCRLWIKDVFVTFFPVIILASTPLYFYYAVNFLPNIPAISFSFAGLYHILQYRRSGSLKQLAVSTLYFVLATLLKPTDGGIVWLACTAVMLSESVFGSGERKKVVPVLASFAVIAGLLVGWFLFVKHYNDRYYPSMNAQGIYPIWSMPADLAKHTFFSRFAKYYWTTFQHGFLHIAWMVFAVIFVAKWRSMDKFLRSLTLWLIAGVLVYAALWFDAFLIHDYYELIFAIPVVFLSICVSGWYANTVMPRLKRNMHYVVYGVLLCLVVVSIYHNRSVQKERYDDSNIAISNAALFEVEPYLRKIGIAETDSVLSVPDNSPNISLTAFGNPGYTSGYYNGLADVRYCKRHGIKYMIIADSSYIHKPEYEPYTKKLMGEYKGIYIYDISQVPIQ